MQNLFTICSDKGRFVFEVFPGLFGCILTLEELQYWMAFNCIAAARMHNIDITDLHYYSAMNAINRVVERQKADYESARRQSASRQRSLKSVRR